MSGFANDNLNDFIDHDQIYELNIGKSFQKGSNTSHHQFKFDFTPASIDKNQEAKVTVGTKNDIMIQVPHVDGSAQPYTQFTGNMQPCSTKECVLIYDTRTNEFTLERLQTNFMLKKSRLEGSSKAQIITPRCITPTNESSIKKKKTEDIRKSGTKPKPDVKTTSNKVTKEPTPPPKPAPKQDNNIFGNDLNLSDGTDSDSSEL